MKTSDGNNIARGKWPRGWLTISFLNFAKVVINIKQRIRNTTSQLLTRANKLFNN